MRFVIRYGYGTMYMISKRKHKRFLHFVRFTHFGLREDEMTNKMSCRLKRRNLNLIKIAVLRHMGSFDYALREDRMTV